MLGTELFEQRIAQFLDEQCAQDIAFAEKVHSTTRTVKDCCAWIVEELARQFQQNKRYGYDDSEIYGMALHFYDEPKLKAKGNLNFQGLIVSNTRATYTPPELTEEEKQRLQEAAREQYLREQVNKLREAEQKAAQQEQKRVERIKAKQEKQAKQYVQPSLFD